MIRINLESLVVAPIMLLVFLAIACFGGLVVFVGLQGSNPIPLGILALLIGVPGSFLMVMSIRAGVKHLLIDVPGNTIYYVTFRERITVPLDELGPLTIAERRGEYRRNYTPRYYRVEAPGLPGLSTVEWLADKPAQRLRARLEGYVAQAAVRRILAASDAHDDGAYREAPDVSTQLVTIVRDASLLDRALAALERDYDAGVRARARAARTTTKPKS